jgi:glycosyltransferase involved in cell wall biosynthesis
VKNVVALPPSRASLDSEPKPKILFLIKKLVDGGAERVFVNYVRHARSVQPVVVLNNSAGRMYSQLPENSCIEFLGRNDGPGAATGASRGFHARLRRTRAGRYRDMVFQALRILVYSWRLARIAKRTGATVVSCFLMESHLVGLLAKLLFQKNLRILLNVHEYITGTIGYTYSLGLERLALRAIMRFLYPRADQIIVVCDSMKADLIEHWNIDPEKICVAYNPVDLDEIRVWANAADTPLGSNANPVEIKLVFLGRLVHLKGAHHLVEAMGHLSGRLPARALLIGEGDEYEPLRDLCRELGVSDKVDFLGWLDNPWQVLASADLLVQPSLTEAFPQAIAEAMALGVPVVASDCSPGIRDLLEYGKCGRLAPPGNSKALAVAIEEVMADPLLRASYRDLGMRKSEVFCSKNTVAAYERILQHALRG